MKANKTELLAPAGSPAALEAALESGADAIYLGATAFNARMNATNFTREDLKSGIRRAHILGQKIYMTLNTQVYDKELPSFLETARMAYEDGVDALIIADLGAARLIHRVLPDFPLHASTQMSAHNTDMGRLLSEYGYTRVVLARETSRENIRSFCENAPVEAEVFLHGALCVSHSGQCLFSSVVGGRSGNRGECAQPCRLPYKGGYPLSLKDLCLAKYVPELQEMGVASLKIEGRMKSPEYVRDVVRIYRTLLDENRGANDDEMHALSAAFSRGGFTDAYYTSRIGAEMLGIRSEQDKEISRTLTPFRGLTHRAPVELLLTAKRDTPLTLTAKSENNTVTVTGEIPLSAESAPASESALRERIQKTGGTPYEAKRTTVTLDDGLMIPVGWLNALRREALERLALLDGTPDEIRRTAPEGDLTPLLKDALSEISSAGGIAPKSGTKAQPPRRTARFLSREQITPRACAYFDTRYLPLFSFDTPANGVVMPPVIYDSDRETVKAALHRAVALGASRFLVTNLGQLPLLQEIMDAYPERKFHLTGDFRLGVMNTPSRAFLGALGLTDALLSPELTLPKMRDIGGENAAVVYGRLPLMLLEKCVNIGKGGKKNGSACLSCLKSHKDGTEHGHLPSAVLVDRRNTSFPVLREWEHRSVIYNSVPTYMADRMDALLAIGLSTHHYIFSVEDGKEVNAVIEAYEKRQSPRTPVRRFPS